MAARLVLSLGLFAAAVALQGVDATGAREAAEQGLYATLAFGFLTTVVFAALLGRIQHPGTFAAIQIPTDVAIVTALVHFTGGDESLFGFLYVLVVVFGAMVAERRGAIGAAVASAAFHGAVLAAAHRGLLPDYGTPPGTPGPVLLAFWSVQAGALAVVALLASHVSRELLNADAELDASRSDLRRLRSLHERIVESLMSGLLTTDREGRITSFNLEAERITGVPVVEALGVDIDEVIPGARQRVVAPAVGAELPAKPRERMSYRNRRGEELYLGLAGSVLRDADGAARGSVVIFQDVTEVVKMEADLRRSERLAAAGKLAANIAHEVRNPLAAISGSIQMLVGARPRRSSPEQARLMDIVLRETDRLNVLITDFLHYAYPRPPRPEALCLEGIVEDVLRMLENAPRPEVKIETDVDPALRVLADPSQLRQLLWNLCMNAVQAMPHGGSLRVDAHGSTEGPQEGAAGGRNESQKEGCAWVEICVADTGVGIPPEVCDRIFDPFFTTKDGGTGLGLATVHRIVEGNRGSLRVESAVGVGSTFRILLPEAREES
jgi:two-component system sensor histidine kinase PilS (NtrC family)